MILLYLLNGFLEPNWLFYSNRKQFLQKYASEKGFDPEYHENWYSEESQQFLHEVITCHLLFCFLTVFLVFVLFFIFAFNVFLMVILIMLFNSKIILIIRFFPF